MLFIETTTPPPFYQKHLSDAERIQLDKWFIGNRSQAYYLKRFAQFDKQGYLSPKWHWAAFFMTFGWLLYRKRYMDAIVYSVAGWSFIQLNIVIILVAFEFAFMPFIADSYQMMVRIAIAVLIWLFWSFMVARWTDAYYYRMARREIADAIDLYPRQPEMQKQHLKKEGGVSSIGLAIGFGFFIFALTTIKVQFLPIYAKPKENAIIFDTFNTVKAAKARIDTIYLQTGSCPTNLPLTTNTQKVTLSVSNQVASVPSADCAVTARIQNIPFPNRNLNGESITLYRLEDLEYPNGRWGCVTSLNEKQRPRGCNRIDSRVNHGE